MKKILTFLAVSGTIYFAACSKNDTGSGAAGNATINVHLVDGPGAFDRVYIDIQDVQVKATTDTSSTGWTSLNIARKGVYNLLSFKNGLDTVLGTLSLPAGNISQLRLVLGSNNSVVVNGLSYPLQTPSAQQSGLKLAINTSVAAGISYHYWIDFDAARSIVQTGNSSYILKPVIKVFTEATSGAVKGIVLPASSKAWVFAIANVNDTVSSTLIDTLSGGFLLRALPAATYKVSFHSMAGNYRDTTFANVSVTNGAVTNVGTVQLR
ncbi:MAG: hypothetical protein JWQ78_15 [Sediminibacterium sp.]|nr:hypothetical protein [Sediminibacterium sp.]